MVLYHEASHYMQKLINPDFRYPHWPGEGLAEYYGGALWDPAKKKLEVGLIQEGRLAEVLSMMSRDEMVSLEDCVKKDAYTDYTWGWTLVHFLMTDKRYEKAFKTYFVGIANAKGVKRTVESFSLRFISPEESFRYFKECLKLKSPEDVLRLQEEWYSYIRNELKFESGAGLEKAAISANRDGKPIQARRLFGEAEAAGGMTANGCHQYAKLLRGKDKSKRADCGRRRSSWTRSSAPITSSWAAWSSPRTKRRASASSRWPASWIPKWTSGRSTSIRTGSRGLGELGQQALDARPHDLQVVTVQRRLAGGHVQERCCCAVRVFGDEYRSGRRAAVGGNQGVVAADQVGVRRLKLHVADQAAARRPREPAAIEVGQVLRERVEAILKLILELRPQAQQRIADLLGLEEGVVRVHPDVRVRLGVRVTLPRAVTVRRPCRPQDQLDPTTRIHDPRGSQARARSPRLEAGSVQDDEVRTLVFRDLLRRWLPRGRIIETFEVATHDDVFAANAFGEVLSRIDGRDHAQWSRWGRRSPLVRA